MIWQFIIGGVSLGAISSFHCVGMCGPLSLVLPIQHLDKKRRVSNVLLYQVGRIVTYSALGLLFGVAGRSVYVAGFQQWFSVGMGILILFLIIQYWIFRKNVHPNFMNRFYLSVQKVMQRIVRKKDADTFLLFGIANGFLPCGMVYVALAGALVTTEVHYSVAFMAMFGVGTIPAMVAVSLFRQVFSLQVRNFFRRVVPLFISLMAILLILRGMNLGIPFISPVLQSAPSPAIECHQ